MENVHGGGVYSRLLCIDLPHRLLAHPQQHSGKDGPQPPAARLAPRRSSVHGGPRPAPRRRSLDADAAHGGASLAAEFGPRRHVLLDVAHLHDWRSGIPVLHSLQGTHTLFAAESSFFVIIDFL